MVEHSTILRIQPLPSHDLLTLLIQIANPLKHTPHPLLIPYTSSSHPITMPPRLLNFQLPLQPLHLLPLHPRHAKRHLPTYPDHRRQPSRIRLKPDRQPERTDEEHRCVNLNQRLMAPARAVIEVAQRHARRRREERLVRACEGWVRDVGVGGGESVPSRVIACECALGLLWGWAWHALTLLKSMRVRCGLLLEGIASMS